MEDPPTPPTSPKEYHDSIDEVYRRRRNGRYFIDTTKSESEDGMAAAAAAAAISPGLSEGEHGECCPEGPATHLDDALDQQTDEFVFPPPPLYARGILPQSYGPPPSQPHLPPPSPPRSSIGSAIFADGDNRASVGVASSCYSIYSAFPSPPTTVASSAAPSSPATTTTTNCSCSCGDGCGSPPAPVTPVHKSPVDQARPGAPEVRSRWSPDTSDEDLEWGRNNNHGKGSSASIRSRISNAAGTSFQRLSSGSNKEGHGGSSRPGSKRNSQISNKSGARDDTKSTHSRNHSWASTCSSIKGKHRRNDSGSSRLATDVTTAAAAAASDEPEEPTSGTGAETRQQQQPQPAPRGKSPRFFDGLGRRLVARMVADREKLRRGHGKTPSQSSQPAASSRLSLTSASNEGEAGTNGEVGIAIG
ncbi:hypothetical protein PG993_013704 [Apiospora rasikravindrae]|uniref:Uncharacterized protein n=1 Tax=Apiospora rasikravindrae TaxID=990691 RepID=A0ABR1RR21_9PEZI